jgi:methyl-accepting chemotaxis protein
MFLIDYLTGGKEKKAAAASAREVVGKKEAAAQLSFDDAIIVHEQWKERLMHIVTDRVDDLTALDADNVRRDDKCVLGGWIHGIARDRFSTDENFVDLRDEHARFHHCAADVIEHARCKRLKYSRLIIDGEFTRRSRKVIGLLEILRGKYGT